MRRQTSTAIDARNHDIENEEVGFHASDFKQSADAVGCCRNLKRCPAVEKALTMIDDFRFIVNDQDIETSSIHQGSRCRYLMFSQEAEKVVVTDASVATRSAIRRKQILLDPVDNRAGIHVQQAADFVCRVDRFALESDLPS